MMQPSRVALIVGLIAAVGFACKSKESDPKKGTSKAPTNKTPGPAKTKPTDGKSSSAAKQLPAQNRDVHVVIGKMKLPGTLALPARKAEAKLPGVVLVHGSGAHDRDERIVQAGYTFKPFAELSAALVKAGFAVLRYDKRSHVIQPAARAIAKDRPALMKLIDTLSHEQFAADAEAAIALLASQPEVAAEKTFFIGHSIAGLYAPLIAKNTKVAGLVLLAPILLPFREHLVHQAEVQIGVAKEAKAKAKKAKALDPITAAAIDKQIAQSRSSIATYKKVFALIDSGKFPKGGMFMGGSLAIFNGTVALSQKLPEKYAAIKQPLLYINGKNDWICPVDAVTKHRSVMDKKKNFELRIFDDLNHFQYTSSPLAFSKQMAKSVVEWLRKQP